MRTRALALLLLASVTACVVTCSAPQQLDVSPSAARTPTSAPAEPPTSTHTPSPPVKVPTSRATVQPTDTLLPTATPTEASRITFEPGETSAGLKGHLDDHETDYYVLQAREGQMMDVVVEAPRTVGLTIQGADGIPLKRRIDEEMSWHGELPATQDIFIAVSAIDATDYTLAVTVLPRSPEASIEVIEPNGGETWLEGSTYTISWHAVGVERVDIEAASGGKPWLVAFEVDAMSGQLPWPIRVGLVSDFGVATSEAMRLRIYSSDDPDLYDETDEPFTIKCPRIQFEPGAVSAVVTGTLEADGGSYRYALRASAGQPMEMEVVPAQIEIDIWGAEDGSTWHVPAGETNLTIAALPLTQDYFATLTNVSSTQVVYELGVIIR